MLTALLTKRMAQVEKLSGVVVERMLTSDSLTGRRLGLSFASLPLTLVPPMLNGWTRPPRLHLPPAPIHSSATWAKRMGSSSQGIS